MPKALASHLPCPSVHLCPLQPTPFPSLASFWLHTLASSIFPHPSRSPSLVFSLSATYLQLWGQIFAEFESLFKPPQLRDAGCSHLVIEMLKGLENLCVCMCVQVSVCLHFYLFETK